MTDYIFPLRQRPSISYRTGATAFGSYGDRQTRVGHHPRKHAACDLNAPEGAEVLAMASGTIIRGPSEFYRGSYALEVQNDDGRIIRYGEIKQDLPPGVRRGQRVFPGQVIAYVAGYIGHDGKPKHMLHLEMYSGTLTGRLSRPRSIKL